MLLPLLNSEAFMFLAKTRIPRGHTGHSYWADKIHDWQICNIGTGKMNYKWNWESGDTVFFCRGYPLWHCSCWKSSIISVSLKIDYSKIHQNPIVHHHFPSSSQLTSNSWVFPCFQTHLQNQSQSSLIAKGSPKCLDPAQISHVSAGLYAIGASAEKGI